MYTKLHTDDIHDDVIHDYVGVGVRVCPCVDAGEREEKSEICNALLN